MWQNITNPGGIDPKSGAWPGVACEDVDDLYLNGTAIALVKVSFNWPHIAVLTVLYVALMVMGSSKMLVVGLGMVVGHILRMQGLCIQEMCIWPMKSRVFRMRLLVVIPLNLNQHKCYCPKQFDWLPLTFY